MVDTPIISSLRFMQISDIIKSVENDEINLNAIYQKKNNINLFNLFNF
jgi:hypothetical protein